MTSDTLVFAIVFGMALYWVMTTRVASSTSCVCALFACFWAGAAVSEPLTRGQLILGGLLTWWVPFAPWAVLRLSWTTEAASTAIQTALLASRWAQTERIRLWRRLFWWPMVRVNLGSAGDGRLVFDQDKSSVFGRLTLRDPSLARAPWFYGERDPDWPAWTHGMRRHRPATPGPMWRYWGGSRGRGFLDDRELRHEVDALRKPTLFDDPILRPMFLAKPELLREETLLRELAILSRPGHLTLTSRWFWAAEVGDPNRLGAPSVEADDILDALERIARRWAELSSGTAVPTA